MLWIGAHMLWQGLPDVIVCPGAIIRPLEFHYCTKLFQTWYPNYIWIQDILMIMIEIIQFIAQDRKITFQHLHDHDQQSTTAWINYWVAEFVFTLACLWMDRMNNRRSASLLSSALVCFVNEQSRALAVGLPISIMQDWWYVLWLVYERFRELGMSMQTSLLFCFRCIDKRLQILFGRWNQIILQPS